MQAAVDAVADAQVVFERFDVDVGGALLEGLAEDGIDEFDDGCFLVVFVEQVDLFLHVHEGGVVFAAGEDLLEGIGSDAVKFLDALKDAGARGHAPLDGEVNGLTGGLFGEQIKWIVGDEDDAVGWTGFVIFGFWRGLDVGQGRGRGIFRVFDQIGGQVHGAESEWEDAMAKGELGAADDAQFAGVTGFYVIFVGQSEGGGHLAEKVFFIDLFGVDEVINHAPALAGGGFDEFLPEIFIFQS